MGDQIRALKASAMLAEQAKPKPKQRPKDGKGGKDGGKGGEPRQLTKAEKAIMPCPRLRNTGKCRYGAKCDYKHPEKPTVMAAVAQPDGQMEAMMEQSVERVLLKMQAARATEDSGHPDPSVAPEPHSLGHTECNVMACRHSDCDDSHVETAAVHSVITEIDAPVSSQRSGNAKHIAIAEMLDELLG